MNENLNELFQGLPNLGDTEGLNNLLESQKLAEMGIQPASAQPEAQPASQPAQPTQGVQPQAPATQPAQYSAEDIQKIIAENQAFRAQAAQAQATQMGIQRPVQQAQPQPRAQVNPQLNQLIAMALAQGYTPEQIYQAMGRPAQSQNPNAQLEGRVNQIANYLAQQQYENERSAFVEKMTNFGDKWGLSESDLVLFANTAYEKGINVATVKDVEAVFRAIYPDQYALRLQRMQNQTGSQIYGGTSIPEAPRATQSKMEDAYVEAFLKNAMPNQYNNFTKK